jgi:hypothetical protein
MKNACSLKDALARNRFTNCLASGSSSLPDAT